MWNGEGSCNCRWRIWYWNGWNREEIWRRRKWCSNAQRLSKELLTVEWHLPIFFKYFDNDWIKLHVNLLYTLKFLWYSNPPSATFVPTLCIICKLVLVMNTVKILFTWHYTTINHVWNSLAYNFGHSSDSGFEWKHFFN
jgi:hypothetical protein